MPNLYQISCRVNDKTVARGRKALTYAQKNLSDATKILAVLETYFGKPNMLLW